MERIDNEYFNCVGAALAAIAYCADGWYRPNDLLKEFRRVWLRHNAELAVFYTTKGFFRKKIDIKHVVAFNRGDHSLVTERYSTGHITDYDIPFEEIEARQKNFGEKLMFMKRKK